jgi:KipI family sensor histidine kinase inhibitor
VTARARRYGDLGLLIECSADGQAGELALYLRSVAVQGVIEIIPGAETVLLQFTDSQLRDKQFNGWEELWTAFLRSTPEQLAVANIVILPVRYDGADLSAVAATLGISSDEVVRRHTAVEYTSSFLGFVPGFAYLRGLDPTLAVARRSDPRTQVPTGSVAIAGVMTAVYPRSGPGGWQLLGTCTVPLFDVDQIPAALLTAGTRVRFVAI